nr:unnamed protein product [Callosobruchus analis]
MRISVPKTVRKDADVTLACDYDLESAALYSIKWYRHDVEFYRYVIRKNDKIHHKERCNNWERHSS